MSHFLHFIKLIKYIKYYYSVLLRNWFNKKDSYSQHGEDLLVEKILGCKVNSFIDIGANDGVLFSNTFKFAKYGAAGLCIEPSPRSFKKLRLNHLFHSKIACLNYAISNRDGKIYFIEDGYEETLSRVSNSSEEGSKEIQCCTFNTVLNKYPNFKDIDLLSVDVEGHELQVFEGLDFNLHKPEVIVVELLDLSVKKLEIKNLNIENLFNTELYKFLTSKNYILVNCIYSDLIFINKDFRD